MATNFGDLEATIRLKDQLTAQLRKVNKEIEKAGGEVEHFGLKLQRTGTALGEAGRAVAPLALAITGLGTAIFTMGKEFEVTMARVGVITDIGVENIGEMSDAVIELSRSTGQGPAELAAGLMVVASTGLQGAEALAVLESAARASAVGLGETKDIARAVTSAITAYADEGLSASDATDKLFAAVRAGGAEADEFAGTLGRVVGIASQVGVSFDEVLASVATFTRLGVSAEEAVTALRGTMSVLLKPSKEAEDQLKALGTSLEELRATVQERGLMAALTELVERTNGNEEALAAVVPNVRALAGIMGTAGSQAQAYAQNLSAIEQSAGDLDDAFDTVSDTIEFRWQQALADTQRVAVKMFDLFREEFVGLLENFNAATRATEEWVDALRDGGGSSGIASGLFKMAEGLIAFSGAAILVGGAMRGIGAAGVGLGVSSAALSALSTAVGGFVAAVGTGLAFFTLTEWAGSLPRYISPVAAFTDAIEILASRIMNPLGPSITELAKNIDDRNSGLNQALGGLGSVGRDTAKQLDGLMPPMKGVFKSEQDIAKATDAVTRSLSERKREQGEVKRLTEEEEKALRKYNAALADYAAMVAQVTQRGGPLDLNAYLQETAQRLGLLGGLAPRTFDQMLGDWGTFVDNLRIGNDNITLAFTGATDTMYAEWLAFTDKLVSGGKEGASEIAQAFEELPRVIMSAITGGGNVAGAIGGLFGESIFADLGKKLASSLKNVFGRVLGSILPGIGTLIGSGLGSLISKGFGALFGSRGRDMVKEFAASFGGFDALREKMLVLGTEGERLWVRLTQGVGRNNPDQARAAIDAINEAFGRQERRLEALRGHFGDLQGAVSAFGGVIPSALDPLVQSLLQANNLAPEFRAILEGLAGDPSWETLQSIAEKYGIELSALGDKFAQARISDIALGYARDIGILIDSGADLTGILIGMADEMSALVTEALQSGTTLPETLRPYIEKLIEMGLLLGPDGEVRTGIDGINFADIKDDALEAIKELLEQIRDLLANDLPNAAAAAASGINSAFTGINAPSLGEFSASKDEELPGFASGTGGRYLDFGSGTPAMLHGRERVMTESEGAAQASVLTDIKNLLMRMISDQPRATSIAVRDALLAARVR